MSNRGETEAYLAAELDSLTQAHAAGDQAAVTRRIEHVRAEAGPETAAVLERMLKEQEARHAAPPKPEFTPTTPASGARDLSPPSRTKLLVVFSTVTAALLVTVTVLATVIILRPPTTTASPPPPQATGNPTGPTTTPPTSTSSTNVPPPVALSTAPPPGQTWTQAWPQPKKMTMPADRFEASSADLDIPQVEHVNSDATQFSDFYYGYRTNYEYAGLFSGDGTLMGAGTATLPDPESCFSAARTLAVGYVKLADMVPGTTAWCIVTKKGSLVWLHLLSGGGVPEPSGNELPTTPTLTFELMKWKKAN